ncbi:4473_t:CDS:2 [Funneliformis geosporum]|uniref:4638_t:CDS:1 n=1 Tax=Funneliformis geosporum TaxID=1117311 RepID=A0A9W4WQT0_9GLOM|nr:4473_t:CDS:2 [Funneliformis geosporum]CAI2179388.1 4638_t:CDS:2 [Funneliformis geosporum]
MIIKGVEETLLKLTRETKKSSKATQICAKIDELLENVHKVDVVEINLPDKLDMNKADANDTFDISR